jgi:energy-coupling factor transporter ATP-binding protein EcfA2
VGPSGSGKSTLARAIAGLIPREYPGEWRGTIRVGDTETVRASQAEVAARVGIVFQDPASQLVMERVADDVAFGLENRAWPLEAMRARVPAALAEMGLAGFESRSSGRLSGGEQQRLAIAGVLAPGPGVIVLDEPTANLDPNGTAAVFEGIAALRAHGATIILVEHRAELAWPVADLVLALDADGSPIDLGRPDDVLRRSAGRLARAGIWLPVGPSTVFGSDMRAVSSDMRAASSDHEPPGAVARPGPVALEMAGVGYEYERTEPALAGIKLAVAPGERVALVGPNGSGKTTLLRLALGLLRPSAGRVRLGGVDPARLSAARIASLAGYVVQDPELGFVADTVAEEVMSGLDAPDRRRAAELAGRLDLPLETFGERSPYRLSGGEQRRLSLVTALASRPQLVVLDEPTFGQDRHGHEALVAALGELTSHGGAMVAATHDERFVRDAARRRVDLVAGRIVADRHIAAPQAAVAEA